MAHPELRCDAEALAYVERARSRLFLEQLAFALAGVHEEPLDCKQIRECLRR
jgi:hypothetical protein